MSYIGELYFALKIVSLVCIIGQLTAFAIVGTKVWKSPERNLVHLWILFTAYNFVLLTYNIITFTKDDEVQILKITIDTVSNILYSICHWKFSWQYLSSAYQIEFDLGTGYQDNRKIKCRKYTNIMVITVVILGNLVAMGISIHGLYDGATVNGGGELWYMVIIGVATTVILMISLYKIHKIMMQYPIIQRSQYMMKLFLILFDVNQIGVIVFLIVSSIYQNGDVEQNPHRKVTIIFLLMLNNLRLTFAI